MGGGRLVGDLYLNREDRSLARVRADMQPMAQQFEVVPVFWTGC
jgi:hypothetical protein